VSASFPGAAVMTVPAAGGASVSFRAASGVIAVSALLLVRSAGSGASFSLLAGVVAVAALLSFELAVAAASVGELSSSGAAKMAAGGQGRKHGVSDRDRGGENGRASAIALVVTTRFDFVSLDAPLPGAAGKLSRAECYSWRGLKTKTFARWMKHLVGVEEVCRHAEEVRELSPKERLSQD
jgi:hypothetical protein